MGGLLEAWSFEIYSAYYDMWGVLGRLTHYVFFALL
jgi:hypothetical protein